jgi:hypothetical protein
MSIFLVFRWGGDADTQENNGSMNVWLARRFFIPTEHRIGNPGAGAAEPKKPLLLAVRLLRIGGNGGVRPGRTAAFS